jgi:hypothetical protein
MGSKGDSEHTCTSQKSGKIHASARTMSWNTFKMGGDQAIILSLISFCEGNCQGVRSGINTCILKDGRILKRNLLSEKSA